MYQTDFKSELEVKYKKLIKYCLQLKLISEVIMNNTVMLFVLF